MNPQPAPDEIYLTRAQIREVDRRAMEELGIPGVVLMENAALGVVREIQAHFQKSDEPRSVVILCGGGNNGGDGYAIARHLHNAGYALTLYAATPLDKLSGDAAVNANICAKMKLDIQRLETREQFHSAAPRWNSAGMLIDALLGTGFSGSVRPEMAVAIRAANRWRDESQHTLLAVDVPSGLDCDTGAAGEAIIQADITVTFVARKIGFKNPRAQECLGRVVVGEIGVPPELVTSIIRSA